MQLIIRRPFHPADVREPLASWPVTIFVMMVSGFVTGELCSEWKTAQSVFLWLPERFIDHFSLSPVGGWIDGVWAILVYPLVLWFVLGVIASLNSDDASIMIKSWRLLALPIAVVISTGHMAKGLAKFVSWVGFLPYALKDPPGIITALKITSKAVSQPASLLSMPVVSIMGMLLVITGIYFSAREARLANPETYRGRLVPKFVLGILFVFIIFGWGYIK
jgi:hypothetical protein